jgi:CheY-like chemotaxis protein/signal transduction histidine kinase
MATMHTLGDTADRRPALSADSLCEAALAAFIRYPDCRTLTVVEDEKPIAVIHREAFLARMEMRGAAAKPILEVAEPDPLVAEAGEPVDAFVQRAMAERPSAVLSGFIIAEKGAYQGVCDLGRLLPVMNGAAAVRPSSLIERICAEVREPIAHALAAAEALKRLRLPEDASPHLDVIADAGQTALALLDVAADLQQAEAGRLAIAAEPRRLQELMDNIEARWQSQAEVAGVTLLVSYDGAPDCAAVVDAGRLMQVFDALIGHALAHSQRGVVEASLQVRKADAGLTLTGRVRDNGVTYPPDYLAGMFRGLSDAAAAGGAGMQLQLMLAQHAIEAMAGRLEAKANPGPGATVAFELAAEPAEDQAAATDTEPGGEAARSAHILVVDDNATNRMVVEALCEMFDCSTESVADGVEAVEAAKGGRYDVILMDIKMPRMDGVTATREIRKLAGAAGRVPIIALTANADVDEVAQYLAAGMRAVVEKPIKPERLLEALDAALAEKAPPASAAAA